ncbi:MAG: prolipoprotein diacylglyceryl transferase family protein [Myxococcota bacterium]
MASALQLGLLCVAFWTAVLGFRSRQIRGVSAIHFVAGLGLGAVFAHGGWVLLHVDQVAQHPELIGNPALGRSVLFFPLGLLALTPARASAATRRAWLDASFAALPPALAVARLGCLVAGCCGGLPIGGEFFLKWHPTPLYEMGGLWLLGLIIRGCPSGLVAPVVLAGFGAVRAAVDPLRAPAPLGSPLLPPGLLALAWLVAGAALGLRPLREAVSAPSSRGRRSREGHGARRPAEPRPRSSA